MLKRNIAVLIAGALLSAQAGLAVAENASWQLSPAEAKYFEEQAARNPNPTGGPSPVFPASTGTRLVASPELIKYFAERPARGPMGVANGVFNDECLKNSPG
jgi:hypothetical protein